jgi:hypothetical protein
MDGRSLIAIAALALAACGPDPAAPVGNAAPAADVAAPVANEALPAGNAASPAATAGAEVEATSAGLSVGDHLWANFAPAGGVQPEPALVDDMPIAAFLKAHEGQRVSVRIETVNRMLEPPGERMDVRTVTAARSGATSAQDWWDRLTTAQKQAAERGVWEAGSGG